MSIWSVLLVLSLGLPRLLVVCKGPYCHGSIEFVHAPGSCCDDHQDLECSGVEHGCSERGVIARGGAAEHGADAHDAAGTADGDTVAAGPRRCTDVPLGLEDGPLPDRMVFEFDAVPGLAGADSWGVCLAAAEDAPVSQPATGPPRADRRTQLLATTVLLI